MASTIQRSFSGGEISPSLNARTDQVKYATGLRTCRNFIVQRHGGVATRAGTEYVASTKGNGQARLLKFVYNDDQTYILEFGDQYLRVFQNAAPVVNSGTPAWSNATAYQVADLVYVGGVYYYCILAHTNQTPPNATYWYAMPGTLYEIPTPYLAADLAGLNYVQSADVITIVHPSYAPRTLSRTAHTAWTLAEIPIVPQIATPVISSITGGGASPDPIYYGVTAIDSETGEESLVGSDSINAARDASSPIVVTWGAVTGAGSYNIYVGSDGVTFGFLINVLDTTYTDDVSVTAQDMTVKPPSTRNPFNAADKYPSTVTYYQQRRVFANTNERPETVFASRTGSFTNFTTSTPLQDDDAVTFQLAGRQVNAVRHLLDLGRLLVFTSGGEWEIEGDQAGVLTPSGINPRQQLYHGAGPLAPIVIGNAAVFQQARGSVIRDLVFDVVSGFKSTDLTLFATHLFDGYTITAWDFQQTPHSVLWAVRSDGTMVALTYIREHEVWGWHRHDTDGVVEDVCVLPEGTEDRVYLIVRRTIDGSDVRYLERMTSRIITETTDLRDLKFLDACLSYDGRNDSGVTITLTSGAGWTHDVQVNVVASTTGVFSAGDVGNAILFYDEDGAELLRVTLETFLGTDAMMGRPAKDVPVALRSVATTAWARAVDEVSGLDHLEGKAVSIMADGNVVASPNNPDYPSVTVSSGTVTLDQPYAVIHVGLPYTCDLETLDLDTPQGPSLKPQKLLITKVTVEVERTRGLWAGGEPPSGDDPLEALDEFQMRDESDGYGPLPLKTDGYDVNLQNAPDHNGRVFLRQVDPLPATVLAILPQGYLPSPQ